MDFKSFKLEISDMSAQSRVYEGYRTENGVHLEYYIRSSRWDKTASGFIEEREIVRACNANEELYQKLRDLFDKCRIAEWAGFIGHEPADVLDGSSMSFNAVLADGNEVNACGTNNFPDDYSMFKSALHKLTTSEKIKSEVFTDGTYKLTLPKSWIGVVTANFSDGCAAFSVDKNDGGEILFLIFDNNEYEYSPDYCYERKEAGRLVSSGNVRFITMRFPRLTDTYGENISGEALAVLKNRECDGYAAVKNLCGVNGYTFYPEEG